MSRVIWSVVLGCVVGWVAAPMTAVAAENDAPVVKTSSGAVRGTVERGAGGTAVAVFRGIPYAKPPVGKRRWAPPEETGRWLPTREATQFGPPCPQQAAGWNDRMAAVASEDCLYLNVWSAAAAPGGRAAKGEAGAEGRSAVLVYIHGGGNEAGTASEDLANGLALAPRGVLLVTFNYRVGAFGFLTSPELRRESGAEGASGNYGLQDQIAALQWVKREIGAFGGDPERVTVMGQSAGGADLGALMASPRAKDLFAAAIEESGTVLGVLPAASAGESDRGWAPVRARLGESLSAMRKASTEEVLQAERDAGKTGKQARGLSVDGYVLTETPAATFAAGREATLPLMIGNNVQEIVPEDESAGEVRRRIETTVPKEKAAALEAVYGLSAGGEGEPGAGGAPKAMGDASARLATDVRFRCPARAVARLHSGHGAPVWEYEWTPGLPWQGPAVHSSELFFLFHYFHAQHGEQGQWTPADEAAADLMERFWTNFAKTGDPNRPEGGEAGERWPRFTAEHEAYEEITLGGPKPEERLAESSCSLIPTGARAD